MHLVYPPYCMAHAMVCCKHLPAAKQLQRLALQPQALVVWAASGLLVEVPLAAARQP
jgi:hypothetical protein